MNVERLAVRPVRAAVAYEFGHQRGQPVQAQTNHQPIGLDDKLLDQQLNDPRPLGREQFVPQGVLAVSVRQESAFGRRID